MVGLISKFLFNNLNIRVESVVMKLVKILVFSVLSLMTGLLQAQNNRGLGGELAYNFQTSGLGVGVRYEIEYYRFTIVPQVVYYPGFNDIHEFHLGVSGHLNVWRNELLRVYALGNLSYNGWFNYEDNPIVGDSFSNWGAELGVGATTSYWKLAPFIEYRYNVKWYETNLRVGLMYYFRTGEYTCQPYH